MSSVGESLHKRKAVKRRQQTSRYFSENGTDSPAEVPPEIHSASLLYQSRDRLISLSYISDPHLTLPTGLSYITSVVRKNEDLSTWFCYFIPAQLAGNWLQFLTHRSFVPISVDNYPGYLHMSVVKTHRTQHISQLNLQEQVRLVQL